MHTRRRVLQTGLAAAALSGAPTGRLAAQDRFDQDALLQFYPLGTVTLMHISDLQEQMMPHYMCPPSVHLGVGDAAGKTPYLTDEAFRIRYGIGGQTPMDYAFTSQNFADLAKAYGPMGGIAHLATLVRAIRSERPEALLLTGGDALLGSVGPVPDQQSQINAALEALGVDATAWAPKAQTFERGGARIAVIKQPRADVPVKEGALPSGQTEARVQEQVLAQRAKGAALVVLLSQNGFDADKKLAARVTGIDVILSGHSHEALPEPVVVGATHILCSGGQGRFVARLDLDVQDGAVKGVEHKLIPVFSELIRPDPAMAGLITRARQRYVAEATKVIGRAQALLSRRGTVRSTWDDVICEALMQSQGAQVAFAPAQRWGRSVLPGQEITHEDIASITGGSQAATHTREMTGAAIKDHLEDAAEAAFHADPYRRRASDMMRTGGLRFALELNAAKGARIKQLSLRVSDQKITPEARYLVAEWGDKGAQGEAMRDILTRHITRAGRVGGQGVQSVRLIP